jgi:hypothetical protein
MNVSVNVKRKQNKTPDLIKIMNENCYIPAFIGDFIEYSVGIYRVRGRSIAPQQPHQAQMIS